MIFFCILQHVLDICWVIFLHACTTLFGFIWWQILSYFFSSYCWAQNILHELRRMLAWTMRYVCLLPLKNALESLSTNMCFSIYGSIFSVHNILSIPLIVLLFVEVSVHIFYKARLVLGRVWMGSAMHADT